MSSSTDNCGQATRITIEQAIIPSTQVSVYQALYDRRMAWKFKDEPVTREAIERMLDAAVWAPNHRLTEPWRFFVLEKGSPARQGAADLAYESALQRNNNSARAERARQTVLEPPVLVYVYCVPGPDEEVSRENYAAVCCAVQNISLAGGGEGVAGPRGKGGATPHPPLRKTLGAAEDWIMVAMLSIGVPAEMPSSRRTPVGEFVRWMGAP